MMTIEQQMEIIAQGTAEIINMETLRSKLEKARSTGKPLIIKFGLDPSAPDIHLGHTVPLQKIKQLQELGHRAVLIIGDFTGRIGDPTGKSKIRRQLTEAEVQANARTYERQLARILDPNKTEFLFNSHWLGELRFADVIELASRSTIARMLERDDFHKRFTNNQPVGIHELLYPLMQAYDSVQINADIEIGGTDQRFNILAGRDLMQHYGQEQQAALFMPLLEGLDGVEKMSKSLGNYIGIDEHPNEMYGKVMSIPDHMILRWFTLLTDIRPDELTKMKEALEKDRMNPRDAKKRLAREITAQYWGEDASTTAEEHFVRVFSQHELPEDIPVYEVSAEILSSGAIDLPRLMVNASLAATASEARRLIRQGAVRLNGTKTDSFVIEQLTYGEILQVGKRRVVRLLSS